MNALTSWLAQPSTIRGIIQMASIVGVVLNPAHIIAIITVGGGLVSLINLVKKDSSKW